RPVRAHRLADVAVDAELVALQGHARIVSAGRRGTVPPPEKAVRIRAGSASAGGRSPGPTGPASPGRGPCTAPPSITVKGSRPPAGATGDLLGLDEHVVDARRFDRRLDPPVVGRVADVDHAHTLHGVGRDL